MSEALELDRRVFSTGSMGLTSGLVGWEEMAELSSTGMAAWPRVGMRERNLSVRRDAILFGLGELGMGGVFLFRVVWG